MVCDHICQVGSQHNDIWVIPIGIIGKSFGKLKLDVAVNSKMSITNSKYSDVYICNALIADIFRALHKIQNNIKNN
jgi:hypothetical protein